MNNSEHLEFLFRQWWAESYATPPGVHAVMTHVGFAAAIYESILQAGKREGIELAGDWLQRNHNLDLDVQTEIARIGAHLKSNPDLLIR